MKNWLVAFCLALVISLGAQDVGLSVTGAIQLGNPTEIPTGRGVLIWDGINFVGIDSLYARLLTKAHFDVVTDRDGNLYRTVRLGTKWWMMENLRTATFADGSPIRLDSSDVDWSAGYSAYCWYGNDSSQYDRSYGKLYNWYAVSDVHGLCPDGWHIPSDLEWHALASELGGLAIAGGKMKELGNGRWQPNNAAATNESGFSARPAGCRSGNVSFVNLNYIAYWWTSSVLGSNAWYSNLYNYNGSMDINQADKFNGLSVRCVK